MESYITARINIGYSGTTVKQPLITFFDANNSSSIQAATAFYQVVPEMKVKSFDMGVEVASLFINVVAR